MKIKQISTEGTFLFIKPSFNPSVLHRILIYKELIFSIIAERQNLLGIDISLHSFLVFILNIYI